MMVVFRRPELGDYRPPRPRFILWVAAYIGGSLGGALFSALLVIFVMLLRDGLDPRAPLALILILPFAVPICMMGTGIVTVIAFFMWSILANKRAWVWAFLGAGVAYGFIFEEGFRVDDWKRLFVVAMFMTCGAMATLIFWKILTQDDQ